MDNFQLLQSKLKRHKISCIKEGQRIIIGKSKIDMTTLLGLVILPIVFSLGLVYMFFAIDSELVIQNTFKILIAIVSLMITALFYLKRIVIKYKSNRSIKVLFNNQLKINDLSFSSHNINHIYFKVREEKDELQGQLYILDKNDIQYLILEIDGNDEPIANDLTWILNYIETYLNL
jgi:hypothetical protein